LSASAHGDRNGVMLLRYAMQRSRAPFELVIKSQEPLKPLLRDPRIIWDSSCPEDRLSCMRALTR